MQPDKEQQGVDRIAKRGIENPDSEKFDETAVDLIRELDYDCTGRAPGEVALSARRARAASYSRI